jgi:hypothetical protein
MLTQLNIHTIATYLLTGSSIYSSTPPNRAVWGLVLKASAYEWASSAIDYLALLRRTRRRIICLSQIILTYLKKKEDIVMKRFS